MGRGRQMSTWASNFGPYPLIFLLLVLQPHAIRKVEAASLSDSHTNSSHQITCDFEQGYPHSSKTFCCNKCNPGFRRVEECHGRNMQTKCEKCKNGEFVDSANYDVTCKKCNKCKANEVELQKCTHIQDTVCKCQEGFYKRMIARTHECWSCKKCGAGERVTSPCRHDANTECECKDFHYREGPSTCKPCQECLKDCEHLCPTNSSTTVKTKTDPDGSLSVAVPVTIVVTALLLIVVWLCHKVIKSRWMHEKKSPVPTSEPPDSPCVSVTSSEPLFKVERIIKEIQEHVPNETQKALPDCVPREIQTSKFIYSVLNVVPVSRITELVRLLGVNDQDVERARRDHPISCHEAQYHMLKRWADNGTRGNPSTLSHQLLQQLLATLRDMGLGGCAESLEMDYDLEQA